MDPKDKKIDTIQNVFVKEVVREWSRYTFQKKYSQRTDPVANYLE